MHERKTDSFETRFVFNTDETSCNPSPSGKQTAWVITWSSTRLLSACLCAVIAFWLRLKQILKRDRAWESDCRQPWSLRAGHNAPSQREDLQSVKDCIDPFPPAATSPSVCGSAVQATTQPTQQMAVRDRGERAATLPWLTNLHPRIIIHHDSIAYSSSFPLFSYTDMSVCTERLFDLIALFMRFDVHARQINSPKKKYAFAMLICLYNGDLFLPFFHYSVGIVIPTHCVPVVPCPVVLHYKFALFLLVS